ncbi:MAG: DUF4202 domain-containing protein [Myxococcota bacterium]
MTPNDSTTPFGAAFERAIAALDAVNAQDPNRLSHAGESRPKELVHSELATYWVRQLESDPSEALLLAARGHHLRRWQLPRSEYPEGRPGYLRWRKQLQQRHAQETGEILREAGYDDSMAERVGDIIRKRGLGLGLDPAVQTLEDALCLVFVETQLGDFAARYPDEKVVDVLTKSLKKMSEAGRAAAGRIELPAAQRELLARSVAALST